jgi:SAM-dependent methyltransferase
MSVKDHFSAHAEAYRAARPGYPSALFDWLAVEAPDTQLAWDAGCGNGQASVALARHFERVIASDPSEAQIDHAQPDPRVEYRVEAAEHSSLASGSVSLVTVAQALHWFDLPAFYQEVRRVCAPGGLLAAWSYAGNHITPGVDAVYAHFYHDVIGPYWPPERRHIENGYARIDFPFAPLRAPVPQFDMQVEWTLAQYCAYLRSWSATQAFLKDRREDPVDLIGPALEKAWGAPDRLREVRWLLHLRVGVVG